MQALILKKIPIRELDELVVCYTEEAGKQAYQAKSVLRPTSKQAAHLDILNLVDFSTVQGNGHPIITGAHSREAFSGIKGNLPAMAAACVLLECFDKLIFEGEADPELWRFLTSTLYAYDGLARAEDITSRTSWAGEINRTRRELLGILGYDPETPLEQVANASFRSLQFARKVLEFRK